MTTDKPSLQIFEPAMCCSTGLCGPDVDPALVAFSSDVKWLKEQGVTVHRYNLSRTPDAFVDNPLVFDAITEGGMDVLPLLVSDGQIVSKGHYPERKHLAEMAGLGEEQPAASGAVNTAQSADDTPARAMLELTANNLNPASSCCGGGDSECC